MSLSIKELLLPLGLVRDNPSLPPRRSFDRALVTLHQGGGDVAQPPEYRHLRTALQRVRVEHMPRLPATVDDVVIQGGWSETWRSHRFLLEQNNNVGFALFCSDEDLDALLRCQDLFMDGTFYTVPNPYKQFFTVHGSYLGAKVIMLAGALITGKSVSLYIKDVLH